jgi:tetratricopeptide (TPR) repeat protein
MKKIFLTLSIGSIVVFSSIAQKPNETSAAMEYKKFSDELNISMMGGGGMESAQKSIKSAKQFIDLASEHETTKNSPKTLFYKGEIYLGHLIAFSNDTAFVKEQGQNYFNIGIDCYKKSLSLSNKFKQDIEESINKKRVLFDIAANALYDKEKFLESADCYEIQVKLFDVIGKIDSLSIFNSGICYQKAEEYVKAASNFEKIGKMGYKETQSILNASFCYRKMKNSQKAKELIIELRKKLPIDKELLIELVNINIELGDAEGAEKTLNEAIKADSLNKQLYYNIGTIYTTLKENEKAEDALRMALKIDPNYTDAQYQLGAHLVNWGASLQTEAGQLDLKDPRFNELDKNAKDILLRGAIILEKYIETNPNEYIVLKNLEEIFRRLGDTEKAAQFKKRADAIK